MAFSINGEQFGNAYDEPELKTGIFFPAISSINMSNSVRIKNALPED